MSYNPWQHQSNLVPELAPGPEEGEEVPMPVDPEERAMTTEIRLE